MLQGVQQSAADAALSLALGDHHAKDPRSATGSLGITELVVDRSQSNNAEDGTCPGQCDQGEWKITSVSGFLSAHVDEALRIRFSVRPFLPAQNSDLLKEIGPCRK